MSTSLQGPILRVLNAEGVELDQRLHFAFCEAAKAPLGYENVLNDAALIAALLKTGPKCAGVLDVDGFAHLSKTTLAPRVRVGEPIAPSKVVFDIPSRNTFETLLAQRGRRRTIRTVEYLKEVIRQATLHADEWIQRPYTADVIARLLKLPYNAAVPTSKLTKLLADLDRYTSSDDDFQLTLALSDRGLRVRIGSILDDVAHRNDTGVVRPHRLIVPTLCTGLGAFTADQIGALEELLNSGRSRESDFQLFFEQHPHFLRRWDLREVYSHIVLTRPEGALIPDFLLTDRELQRAAIIELKLPNAKLIRRKHNRDRFADALLEARAQLLRYREWFRSSDNRTILKRVVGMQIYEPQMIVIIGRSSEFRDELDRQLLCADNPDIEVLTYDDLLIRAQRRRLLVDGA